MFGTLLRYGYTAPGGRAITYTHPLNMNQVKIKISPIVNVAIKNPASD
jgi:hypothetical protein